MSEARKRYNIEGVERAIQKLLLELDERLWEERMFIDIVEIDTREFSEMRTEIIIEEVRNE
jgi:hypothetical protein